MQIFAGKPTADDIRGAFPGAAMNVIMALPHDGDPDKTNAALVQLLDQDDLRDYMAALINRSPLETTPEFKETYLRVSTQVVVDQHGVTWLRMDSPGDHLVAYRNDVLVNCQYTDNYLNAEGELVAASALFGDAALKNVRGQEVTLSDVEYSRNPFAEHDYRPHLAGNAVTHRELLSDAHPSLGTLPNPITTLWDNKGYVWKRRIVTTRHGILCRKERYATGEWTCRETGETLPIVNLLLKPGYLIEPQSGRMTDGNVGNIDRGLLMSASMAA